MPSWIPSWLIAPAAFLFSGAVATYIVARYFHKKQVARIRGGDEVRQQNAKAHLVRALTRRVAIEGYQLENTELTAMRNAMADRYNVKATDLPDEDDLRRIVFAKAFQSDHLEMSRVVEISKHLGFRRAQGKWLPDNEDK